MNETLISILSLQVLVLARRNMVQSTGHIPSWRQKGKAMIVKTMPIIWAKVMRKAIMAKGMKRRKRKQLLSMHTAQGSRRVRLRIVMSRGNLEICDVDHRALLTWQGAELAELNAFSLYLLLLDQINMWSYILKTASIFFLRFYSENSCKKSYHK